MWRYQVFKCVPSNPVFDKKEETFYCIKEYYPPDSKFVQVLSEAKGSFPDKGGWTVSPIFPMGETREELIECLEHMLHDAKKYEPMEEEFDNTKCERCDRPN